MDPEWATVYRKDYEGDPKPCKSTEVWVDYHRLISPSGLAPNMTLRTCYKQLKLRHYERLFEY